MSGATHGARTGPRDLIVFAVVLIVVGVVGLATQLAQPGPEVGGLIVGGIGAAIIGLVLIVIRSKMKP